MPLLLLGAVGVAGFGAGFFTGSTAGKIAKVALLGGSVYLGYKLVKGVA